MCGIVGLFAKKEVISFNLGLHLSKMLESMANAFIHPLKNDLPPSIGTHAYSSIPLKRKFRRRLN